MPGEKKEEAAESVRASLEASIKQIETGGDTTDLEGGDEEQPEARTGEAEGEQPVEEEPEGEVAIEEEPEGEREIEEPDVQAKVERDQETGKFKKVEGEPAKKLLPGEKPVVEKQPLKAAALPARAPASLSPAERAAFAEANPVLQRAITRRDAEVTKALNDTAEARKGFDTYRQIVGPYEQQIRAEGSTPEIAIGKLLRMSMAMRFAPTQTKIQLFANMAQQFLPRDEASIEALDQALGAVFSGKAAPAGGGGPTGQFMDPRFDAFMADLSARAKEREDKAQGEMRQKYEKFAETHEYFNDVKPYMAALIQAEAERGVALSDEDAYDKACLLHPEVAPIVQQQKAAEAARRGNPRLQRAKAAGSSVRASPAGRVTAKENEGDQPDSVRGSIEKSIRQLEARAKQ
jgi:hypothetical protein